METPVNPNNTGGLWGLPGLNCLWDAHDEMVHIN